ncbi:hypothetical protein ACEV8G_01300 [Vibrio parahaemolyticus]|nr:MULTISPECIES: hypothetical protein [Vibrio]HAS6870912.1 hypothetical protein [Vibrio parahaemolyticus]MBF4221292.1 hypothetical protein [Vibrio anguillarum]MBF4226637.1 hypothetical protein [Vibrio anguillarum]MBF4350775.1 hypothetical protein [Vibrio anguillarum]MBT2993859.1 hypothetical protein [Vibrio anguillarum]
MSKSKITEQKLRNALERLKNGNPERTKSDGKISILRINNEAGLSRGAIYHYKEFVEEAKAEIEIYNSNKKQEGILQNFSDDSSRLDKIKSERDREARLKKNYREQRDNIKAMADEVIKRDASWAYRCLELQVELSRLAPDNVIPFDFDESDM